MPMDIINLILTHIGEHKKSRQLMSGLEIGKSQEPSLLKEVHSLVWANMDQDG